MNDFKLNPYGKSYDQQKLLMIIKNLKDEITTLKKANLRKDVDLQRYRTEIKKLWEVNTNLKYELSTYEYSYDDHVNSS